MPSCITCKFFTGDAITKISEKETKTFLICENPTGYDLIEERDALDDNKRCDFYVEELDDYETEEPTA